MRRLQVTAFLLAAAGIAATADNSSQAETQVGGAYRGSTTWLRSESPYVSVQNVEVPSGATLTIEPGVEVRLADHSFIVRGTLIARHQRIPHTDFVEEHRCASPSGLGGIAVRAPVIGFDTPACDSGVRPWGLPERSLGGDFSVHDSPQS